MKFKPSFLLILLLSILTSSILSAQEIDVLKQDRKNNIYVNILSDASIMSINYERIIIKKEHSFFTAKIGVGANNYYRVSYEILDPFGWQMTVPQHISYNVGGKRSFMEFGIGGTLITDFIENAYYLYPIIGYRLMPGSSGKFSFRVTAHPFFLNRNFFSPSLTSPLGISMGFNF